LNLKELPERHHKLSDKSHALIWKEFLSKKLEPITEKKRKHMRLNLDLRTGIRYSSGNCCIPSEVVEY